MVNRFQKLGLIALFLLLLSGVGIASSKVAVIKVSAGTATLDGEPIVKAALAGEGQLLEMSADSIVRIQLLGSKSELTLNGTERITISKSSLLEISRKVSRNSVAVATDIGNRNTALASVTRGTSEIDRPVALRPIVPPTLDKKEQEYVLNFDIEMPFHLRSGESISVTITPVGGEGRVVKLFGGSVPLTPIRMRVGEIEPGQAYRLLIAYDDAKGGTHRYYNSFRLLTPAQEQFLKQARTELLKLSLIHISEPTRPY